MLVNKIVIYMLEGSLYLSKEGPRRLMQEMERLSCAIFFIIIVTEWLSLEMELCRFILHTVVIC